MTAVAVFGIVGAALAAFGMLAVIKTQLADRETRAALEDARRKALSLVWLAFRLVRPRKSTRGRRRAA